MKQCQYCGAANQKDAAFCGQCGTRMLSAEQPIQLNQQIPAGQAGQLNQQIPAGQAGQLNQQMPAGQTAQLNQQMPTGPYGQPSYSQPGQSPSPYPVHPDWQQPAYPYPGNLNQPAQMPPVMADAPVVRKRKKSGWIKYLVILLVFAIVLGGGYFALFLSSFAPFRDKTQEIAYFYDMDLRQTFFFYGNQLIEKPVDGNVKEFFKFFEGEHLVVNMGDDGLYLIGKDKIERVSDETCGGIYLAQEAQVIIYLTRDHKLYTYDIAKSRNTEIADDIRAAVISPDAKSIVVKIQEDDDDDSELFLYQGKDEVKLGKNLTPVLVSNGGKQVYALNEESSMYRFVNKGEKEKIISTPSYIYTNSSQNEIILGNREKMYYLKDNGEKEQIGKEPMEPITNAKEKATRYYPDMEQGRYLHTVHVNVKSLLDRFFFFYGSSGDKDTAIYSIDGKRESKRIISGTGYPWVAANNGYAYYIRNGSLYYAKNEKEINPQKIASEVNRFWLSTDGKEVYYLNEDKELWYFAGKDPKKVADDVNADHTSITTEGDLFYIAEYSRSQGTLYKSHKGKKGSRIAEDVSRIWVRGKAVFYEGDYDRKSGICNLYGSADGKNFEKVIEGFKPDQVAY